MPNTKQPTLINSLVDLPRNSKRTLVITLDFLSIFFILLLTITLVRGYFVTLTDYIAPFVFINITTLVVLYFSGFYHNILRAFDDKVMRPVLLALTILLASYIIIAYGTSFFTLPKSVYFIYILLLFCYLWFSRSLARKLLINTSDKPLTNRTLIYGAGRVGQELLGTLQIRPEYDIIGFLDDDPKLVGGRIAGIKVFNAADAANITAKLHANSILLAMPSVSRNRKNEIINHLEPLPVKVLSLPSLHQLVSGEVSITDIQEVDVIDLLGREPAPPKKELLHKNATAKSVMITGAGGSIGSEISRQIAMLQPTKLVLFEVSEFALYAIEKEISSLVNGACTVVPVIGSVLDQSLLEMVMQKHQVNTVYHAAAYKHVPLVECNPFSGVMNNTLGTAKCAKAAQNSGVETFVLISTDKAVRPTNVMGASKRLSELVCQGLAKAQSHTQYSMVRFGNVLGSSGSVVPLFRKQIKNGGPITVTHPDITRYFMTIPEAAQLVIQAGAMGSGGDVFLLDMGEPVKIVDLAKKMIRLSGYTEKNAESTGDIEITFTGLRPGEKLYEELLIEGDSVENTSHPRIMRSVEKSYDIAEIDILLAGIEAAANQDNTAWLITQLEKYVEGYVSSDAIKQQ